MRFPPPTAATDGEVTSADTISTFIRLDRMGAVIGLVVAIVAASVDGDLLLWWVVGALAVLAAVLTGAGHRLGDGKVVDALSLVMLGNCITAVTVSIALPFLWPMMALVVVMTVVLAAPHLGVQTLMATLVVGAGAIAAVTILGLRSDDAGAIPDIDDDIEIIVVVAALSTLTIPIGLVVWQTNRLQRRALARATQLNRELQASERDLAASRRRVVQAADAERSRIERDLHDGAQQRLVALAMRLRLLESRTRHGEENDGTPVSELVDELDRSIEELRELAHGIYPPTLEAHGLAEAFRAVARRSPYGVAVEADGIGRFAPTVESALYFTGLEALANASKHAPNASVDIRMGRDAAGLLTLTVADDGPGFDVESAATSRGLLNMADRIGALDGELTVASTPGDGTTVIATVPVDNTVLA